MSGKLCAAGEMFSCWLCKSFNIRQIKVFLLLVLKYNPFTCVRVIAKNRTSVRFLTFWINR